MQTIDRPRLSWVLNARSSPLTVNSSNLPSSLMLLVPSLMSMDAVSMEVSLCTEARPSTTLRKLQWRGTRPPTIRKACGVVTTITSTWLTTVANKTSCVYQEASISKTINTLQVPQAGLVLTSVSVTTDCLLHPIIASPLKSINKCQEILNASSFSKYSSLPLLLPLITYFNYHSLGVLGFWGFGVLSFEFWVLSFEF